MSLHVAESAGRVASRRGRGIGRDERGEVLPVVILFIGVLFTILIGVHVVIIAIARTAAQSAADMAVAAAQVAGPGPAECDNDPLTTQTLRECNGIKAGVRALTLGEQTFVLYDKPPVVVVEPERGTVHALVFVGTLSPVLGYMELTGLACGPLDDVPATQLSPDAWQC